MAVRVAWQEKYGMGLNNTSISQANTFADDVDGEPIRGISAHSQFGLPLTEHAELVPGKEFTTPRKTTGNPEVRVGAGYERTATIVRPTCSLVYGEAEAYGAAAFLWLLFQSGASEAATVQTFNKPTTAEGAEAEVFAHIIRAMSTDTTDWQMITGAVCNSLTFAGEEGGTLSMTGEFMGADYTNVMNPDAGADANLILPGKAPLLFQDATITVAATTTPITSFTLTIENGATPRYYNSSTPSEVTDKLMDFKIDETYLVSQE